MVKTLISCLSILLIASGMSFSQENSLKAYKKGKLLYEEKFQTLSSDWVIETPEHQNSSVSVKDGKLMIDVAKGCTVWLNRKLEGNYIIEYKRKVIVDGGKNDRLSDLNQFWMASDPTRQNLFTRTGIFEEYDNLCLYYVGMGGNSNRTTRFRKYHGNNQKPLLFEYTDQQHLLQANTEYLITTVVCNGLTSFFVNGTPFFRFSDREPLKSGFFGIRTTKSRQAVYDFRIYSLK